MGLNIAVVFVGLCNVRPEYFEYVYKVFERMREEGHNVDFFCHLWIANENHPDDVSLADFTNKFIPTDCKYIQNELIKYIKPKKTIFSQFIEIYNTDEFKISDKNLYASFINHNAQFYGFQKTIDSVDFSEYDFVLRWRYDILGHNSNEEIYKLITSIEECMKNKKTVLVNQHNEKLISRLGIVGVEDTILGIPTKILHLFGDFYTIIASQNIMKSLPHNEIKLAKYLKYKKIKTLFSNYSYTFIRPYTEINKEDYENNIDKIIAENPQSNRPEHLRDLNK
jgi:hypothetical protein